MAAHGLETEANLEKIKHQQNQQLKVFLFDKDDTLVHYPIRNDVGEPINPIEHRVIFEHIIGNPDTTKWIMISRGGGTMRTPKQPNTSNDDALTDFRKVVLKDGYKSGVGSGETGMVGKDNFYCSEGKGYRSTIQSNFQAPQAIFVDPNILDQNRMDPTIVIQKGEINMKEDKLFLSFDEVDYEIKKGMTLEFPNGIVYRVNFDAFFANRDLHENGNNKILQGLYGMAGAGVAVNTGEQMKGLGIELLDPGTAMTVEPGQVFGLDNEVPCVEAWHAAGFTAHHANNEAAIAKDLQHTNEFISDALQYGYKISPVKGNDSLFIISYYNSWKKHDVERVFDVNDHVTLIEKDESKTLNLKAFLEGRQIQEDKPKVAVSQLVPAHRVGEFNTYIEPLAQHLGFESYLEMKSPFNERESQRFEAEFERELKDNSEEYLNSYKKYILEEVNKVICQPIRIEDLTSNSFKSNGASRRFFSSLSGGKGFDRDAFRFLKTIYPANDAKSIITEAVRLSIDRPEQVALAKTIIKGAQTYLGLKNKAINGLVEDAKQQLTPSGKQNTVG